MPWTTCPTCLAVGYRCQAHIYSPRTDMPLTPFTPKCYQPTLAHGTCPDGHPVHLDVDHYDEPMWVHCLISDLVLCRHDLEDVTGAATPGKHRKS